MRLDAVPYLYEREGTNCENLPETHEFLKALRKHVDARYPGRMFLAEANQWPEDAVAYFGDGDECHMAFHFPLMPRLFMSLHQEDRFPIHDIMAQTPAIPENCQWCLFLRNHDELTLEMVTDEERDYMYRAYTRDRHARINLGIRHRLAPLLRQRSPANRTDVRLAVLAARNAGHLLRRRDWHGRQHLPGRSQRRAHADAVVGRPQRGIQQGQPAEALLAGRSSTRNTTTRRSTSRLSREIPRRCSGGSSGWSPCARRFGPSAGARFELLRPENTKVLAFIREV